MATDPGTRSPGHMFLTYTSPSATHTVSARLVDGVDLDDITTLRTESVLWANALKAMLPNTHKVTEFGLRSNEGTILYRETYAVAFTGTHGTTGENWASYTVYIEGTGNSIGAGFEFGHMGFRAFVGAAYQPVAGTKALPITTDAGSSGMKTMLDGSTIIFADFYGQKGDVRSQMPVQFNAHAQRRLGC